MKKTTITLRPGEVEIAPSELKTKGVNGAFRFALNDIIEFPDTEDDVVTTKLIWKTFEVYNIVINKNGNPTTLPFNQLRKAPIDASTIEYSKIQRDIQDAQNFRLMLDLLVGKKLKVTELREGTFPKFANGERCYTDSGESITIVQKYPIFDII